MRIPVKSVKDDKFTIPSFILPVFPIYYRHFMGEKWGLSEVGALLYGLFEWKAED